MNIETPFKLGRTYYKAKGSSVQKRVTCHLCAGKKVVTVLDGYDKRWSVACDACGLGYDAPRGWVTEWDASPGCEPFTIAGVHSMDTHQGKTTWYVKNGLGESVNWEALYETAEAATIASAKHMTEFIEENMRRHATSKATMLKKKTWTVRYHNDLIKQYKERIAYHESKVSQQILEKMEAKS